MENIDSHLIGETAALATSCLWTLSSLLFTTAGRKIGPLSVNAYRIVMAVGFLLFAHTASLGTLLPTASNGQWLWLGMSGIMGLGIGDFGLLSAFVILGPRRSLLVMALSPVFASFGAYLLLAEVIPPLAIAGTAITLAGVIAAILEGEEHSEEQSISLRTKIWGTTLALVGAAGQGIGLVFAKKGINLESNLLVNPLSATLMRMVLGASFIWISLVVIGKLPQLRNAIKNKSGIKYTVAGAFTAPFLGVTLSMVAVTYTQVGIAQTLMSLMPVMIIPVVWVVSKQKTSWRGILGAVIAVIGVAIIFLT